jgi:hypothetical protein
VGGWRERGEESANLQPERAEMAGTGRSRRQRRRVTGVVCCAGEEGEREGEEREGGE